MNNTATSDAKTLTTATTAVLPKFEVEVEDGGDEGKTNVLKKLLKTNCEASLNATIRVCEYEYPLSLKAVKLSHCVIELLAGVKEMSSYSPSMWKYVNVGLP